MADIFISYSRRDSTFADSLRNALVAQGRSVWVDTADILPTSEWRQDIIDAIEAASAVLFVLSPDWLASEVSQRELQYAVEMKKKLIPVVYRDVDHRLVNPALANLNWIFARPTDDPNRALQQILFAIDADLVFWREGSDLLVKARQWAQGNRNPTFTLRGEPLRQAEQWLASSATKNASPSALQVEYITAGRRASARRQRVTISALSVGIVVTLILSIVAGVFANITAQQNVKLAGSAIAGAARAQINANDLERGALLAKAAYHINPSDVTTRDALFSLAYQSPHLETVLQSAASPNTFFNDNATSLGFSSDGQSLASIAASKVIIWDMKSHKQKLQFIAGEPITGAYSLDGHYVAIKDRTAPNHQITLWDATTGKIARYLDGATYENTGGFVPTTNIVFSPDSTLVASPICPDSACKTTKIAIWNVTTGKLVVSLTGAYPLDTASVSFNVDGTLLAYMESDKIQGDQYVVYDIIHNKKIDTEEFPGRNSPLATIAFTPDRDVLGVGESFGTTSQVVLWNVKTQKQLGQPFVNNDDSLTSIAFGPNLHWMITISSESTLRLWNLLADVQVDSPLPNIEGELSAIAFDPDNQQFVSSSNDGQINLWRVEPFSTLSPDPDLTLDNFAHVAFSPDNAYLAFTNNSTNTVIVWDMAHGQVAHKITPPVNPGTSGTGPYSLTFSPDGKKIAVGDFNGYIAIINLATDRLDGTSWTLPASSEGATVSKIDYSADGRYLLTTTLSGASGIEFDLWDAQTHALVQSFASDSQADLFDAAFSPDGKTIAIGRLVFQDKTTPAQIALYDIGQKQIMKTLNADAIISSLTWTLDGTALAFISINGKVYSLPVASGKATLLFQENLTPLLTYSLHFVKDPQSNNTQSQRLLIAYGKRAEIWQITPGQSSQQFVNPIVSGNDLNDAQVSPDGHYITTAEFAIGLITIRSLNPADWGDQACSIANRNLTKAEWEQYIKPYSSKPFSDFARMCSAFPAGT